MPAPTPGTPGTQPKTLAEAMNSAMTSQAPTGFSAGEQTASLADMMSAKTGSAVPVSAGGPRVDSTQERGAAAANVATARQTQAAGEGSAARVQGELDTKQAEYAAGQAQISEQDAAQRQKYSDSAAAIAQQLQQGMDNVSAEQQKQMVSQIGFSVRMSTDEYVTNLQNAGAELRLDTEQGFRVALASTTLGDMTSLFGSKEAAADALNADENTFRQSLASMDIGFAQAMAVTAAKEANSQAMWGAIGSIAGHAPAAYMDTQKTSDKSSSLVNAGDPSAPADSGAGATAAAEAAG